MFLHSLVHPLDATDQLSKDSGCRNCKLTCCSFQVHIDQGEDISRTPGPVKLFLPDFAGLQKQLQQLEPKLTGTQFKADFDPDFNHADITDPWGQQFSISEQLTGNSRGSFEGLLLPCHAGTAAAIALFYRSMLGV